MKKINTSLEMFWFGGNYTNKKVVSINENLYEVSGKKRYTHNRVYKNYTRQYVERILGDNLRVDY